MSLFGNIDHLNAAGGIEAVSVETESQPRIFRGDESWQAVLAGAVSLFSKAEESSVRLVIGKHTVVVQREGQEIVAVALPTGHAIAKSLRRMIRRMSKKDRGPLPERTEPVVAAPPMSPADSGVHAAVHIPA